MLTERTRGLLDAIAANTKALSSDKPSTPPPPPSDKVHVAAEHAESSLFDDEESHGADALGPTLTPRLAELLLRLNLVAGSERFHRRDEQLVAASLGRGAHKARRAAQLRGAGWQ